MIISIYNNTSNNNNTTNTQHAKQAYKTNDAHIIKQRKQHNQPTHIKHNIKQKQHIYIYITHTNTNTTTKQHRIKHTESNTH